MIIFFGKAIEKESGTQQETQEKDILSSTPILKFIVEKKIDILFLIIKIYLELAN